MGNRLLERLQKQDKNGLFKKTQTTVSYNTGFAAFDYRNGYIIQVRDDDENIIKEYASTGIAGGSIVTVIGRSGVAKTTGVIQMAANIIRPFENSHIQHYDLEQATTYTRVKSLTGFTQKELRSKYILKRERIYIEDIFDSIQMMADEKISNRKDYEYETGLLNEFNEPIIALEPTIVILDSIPTIATRDSKAEMEGGTYSNRVAKAIAQFYKKLVPILKEANIILFAINHINSKIDINAFAKTQPQVNTMKMDESIPGGNAPIYYANNILKFVSNGKLTEEKDGLDGFRVRCELIKSRSNKAGQSCGLIYNQAIGFDPILTMYDFADTNDLVEGRNPYRYFKGFEDNKFDSRKFRKSFVKDAKLRFALFDSTIPFLRSQLVHVDPDEINDVRNKIDMSEDEVENSITDDSGMMNELYYDSGKAEKKEVKKGKKKAS